MATQLRVVTGWQALRRLNPLRYLRQVRLEDIVAYLPAVHTYFRLRCEPRYYVDLDNGSSAVSFLYRA